ncbi:MFS transporter [Roseibium sp.]|uniref:MFS transporter n=1 Tax=Roseibium sp. TaxID=1936156 RepID=UPI003A9806F6
MTPVASADTGESIIAAAATQRITPAALATYGLMAFPLAFAGLPIYLHAPEFYASTLGQSLTSLGLALLALRVVDALQDPLIGSLSDRYHTHRRGIIIAGALMLGGGFWMLFHPAPTCRLAWFSLAVFVCTTGFSIVSINLQALGGIWVATETDRTKITGWREGFGLLGLLTAAIAPVLLGNAEDPARAFHLLTLLYVPILFIAAGLLLRWMKQAPLAYHKASPDLGVAGRAGLASLLSDPWRRSFYAIFALNTFASAIPAVLVLFFIKDRLQAEGLTGLFLLLYFLSGALSMALWQWMARRTSKLTAWGLSMALSIFTFFWAVFVGAGDATAYGVICILSGLALGGDLALPPAILADHIDQRRAQAEASRLFSAMTLLSKGSLAVATGLALPLLGLAGYQPGVEMSADMNLALSLTYAALPCLLKLVTLALLILSAERIASPDPAGA